MSEETQTGGLATAIAAVLADVHRVPKNGRNEFHKYDYVTESDLVDHLREKLAEQGVAIFPSVFEHTEEEIKDGRGRVQHKAKVTLEIMLVHGPSGEARATRWVGVGIDAGDKGYYKAYTGAMKYFLLKTFLISTGDDPERSSPTGARTRSGPSKGEALARLSHLLDQAQEAGLDADARALEVKPVQRDQRVESVALLAGEQVEDILE